MTNGQMTNRLSDHAVVWGLDFGFCFGCLEFDLTILSPAVCHCLSLHCVIVIVICIVVFLPFLLDYFLFGTTEKTLIVLRASTIVAIIV
jgi:hypothetical protein